MKTLVSKFRPEQIRLLFLIFLILLVVVFFSVEIPGYFNARFANRLSTSMVVVAVLAVGQTLVFLTRNFDLSVGSITGFTAYFVGQQLWHHPEIPPVGAVLLAIGVGMAMGSINGVIVAYGRVPSIITTIGTLAIFRSFLVEYSHAIPITTNNLPLAGQPRGNEIFDRGGVPLPVYPAVGGGGLQSCWATCRSAGAYMRSGPTRRRPISGFQPNGLSSPLFCSAGRWRGWRGSFSWCGSVISRSWLASAWSFRPSQQWWSAG
jgi:ribose/xylose/arabinose/galactoside ABC-type transport system permease subunit